LYGRSGEILLEVLGKGRHEQILADDAKIPAENQLGAEVPAIPRRGWKLCQWLLDSAPGL